MNAEPYISNYNPLHVYFNNWHIRFVRLISSEVYMDVVVKFKQNMEQLGCLLEKFEKCTCVVQTCKISGTFLENPSNIFQYI